MLKLKQMGVPDILVEWISSFLHYMRDVKEKTIGQIKYWYEINDGVPQGTKVIPPHHIP